LRAFAIKNEAFPFTSPLLKSLPASTPSVDESELIARVLVGEREAFHVLFQRHSAPLLATLSSALSNREDAREVLQETWLRAFQNLASLRDRSRLRPWLVSIALNLARSRLRRTGERTFSPDEEWPASEGARADSFGEEGDFAALRHHMGSLPARQREVLDMRMNHELSHAEIAATLGISEEASRANFYQALKRLKEALSHPRRRA
jgi:RNA polymerase sigma-70 factor (ECF subfamily)